MAKIGRPEIYSEKLALEFLTRVATTSFSIRTICQEKGMPSVLTIYRWLNNNETFSKQYARAKEDQADYLAEEMLDIADDGSNDYMTVKMGGKDARVEDKELTNRSRLRVDTRKWIASKLKPKKYADRIDNRFVDENGNDKEFSITLNIK